MGMTGTSFNVKIIAPQDGTSIVGDKVTIKGQADPAKLNEIKAFVNGSEQEEALSFDPAEGSFEGSVVLALGENNEVTVIGTSEQGDTGVTTIFVTALGQAPEPAPQETVSSENELAETVSVEEPAAVSNTAVENPESEFKKGEEFSKKTSNKLEREGKIHRRDQKKEEKRLKHEQEKALRKARREEKRALREAEKARKKKKS